MLCSDPEPGNSCFLIYFFYIVLITLSLAIQGGQYYNIIHTDKCDIAVVADSKLKCKINIKVKTNIK